MFILAKKYGRLCNRLFNAAHILAFAIENNHSFVNLAFYEYSEYFSATQNDIYCRYPVHPGHNKNNKKVAIILYYLSYFVASLSLFLKKLCLGTKWLGFSAVKPGKGEHIILDAQPAPLSIDFSRQNQAIFFQGWNLRAFESLKKHQDKVREYFKPTEAYQKQVAEFIKSNREGYDVLLGIVIRHGDYRRWEKGKYFYSLDTYLNLMKQLEALLSGKKINFLIFSDEEQDTSSFTAANLNFYFRSGHIIENLYSLAQCDYIVTPPSTYGMWASFYGKVPLCVVHDPATTLSLTESFAVCEG
jgi:hypothetical protein